MDPTEHNLEPIEDQGTTVYICQDCGLSSPNTGYFKNWVCTGNNI